MKQVESYTNADMYLILIQLRWFHSIALRILSAHHFFAGLARARERARSELDRFSMKAQLFRDINGRFLPNELGDSTFLFHLFK